MCTKVIAPDSRRARTRALIVISRYYAYAGKDLENPPLPIKSETFRAATDTSSRTVTVARDPKEPS